MTRTDSSAGVTRLARTVDLSASWNASDADLAGRLHPLYAEGVVRLPEGESVFRGVPFSLGTRASAKRWIVAGPGSGDGLTVDLPAHGPASHLLIAHFADSWRDAAGGRPAGMPVGWVLPAGEPLIRLSDDEARARVTAGEVQVALRRRVRNDEKPDAKAAYPPMPRCNSWV